MRRDRESGLTIPIVALFMVILIVMMALAIDVGVLYTARTSAQHAADAAALAGAFTFVAEPTASDPNGTAAAAALSAATKNKILAAIVPAAEVKVTPNLPYVTVSLTHVAPTFFARAMGTNQATISVTAVAQASTQAQGTNCLRPFWILHSSLRACGSPPIPGSPLQLHQETTPSQWGFLCAGPGNVFGACTDPGAQAIKESLSSCSNVKISCGDLLTEETGNISAIAHMQVNPPPPEFFTTNNADYFYGVGDYAIGGPNGPHSSSSDSVITVAVVDDCNGQSGPGPGANQTLPVNAFSQVFVDGISGTGNGKNPLVIDANVISFNGCGGPGGGSGKNVGPLPLPVRLVQQSQ